MSLFLPLPSTRLPLVDFGTLSWQSWLWYRHVTYDTSLDKFELLLQNLTDIRNYLDFMSYG